MGVRVSRPEPSCRDPHVLLHVNNLPDKHTSYKIMAQKKQGHRPAKNPIKITPDRGTASVKS